MRLRVLAFIAILDLTLIAGVGTVQAHAQYVTSNPEANGILHDPATRVTVTLSEAVQSGTASIRVTDSNGTRVDVGPVNLSASDPETFSIGLRAIGPGVYTVTWTATSAVDGHFTAGSFAFAVQNPDGSLPGPLPGSGATSSGRPVSIFEVAARFLTFAGLAIALGAAVLAAFLWIPAGEGLGLSDRPPFAWGYRALLQWGWIGSFLLVVGTAALWVNALLPLPPSDLGGLVASPFLASTAARLGLGLALLVTMWIASRRTTTALSGTRPIELLVGIGLTVAAILVGSGGTHAAAAPWGLLGPAADAAHLVGVSLWVGGLLALFRVRPWLREGEMAPVAREVFAGFSTLAAYSVALVLGAGVVLSLILVATWEALLGTLYGWIVLAKISLFAPMVAVGAWNRYRVLPASDVPEKLPDTVAHLARNVRIEAILGAVVLTLAAILTSLSPPTSLAGGTAEFHRTATSQGIRFDFSAYPYPSVPGVYTFEILLYNATDGSGFETATNATLTFTLANPPLPPSNATMEGPHGNHFFVTTPALSQRGIWRVDVRIQRTTGPDVRVTFNIAVGASG